MTCRSRLRRPALLGLLLPLATAALALPAAPALGASQFFMYTRDAADFLRRYHAGAMRRPGNLVTRKFADMADSPVSFFRGGAALFYRDINDHPTLKSKVVIPLMGDMHLENLGAYRTTTGVFAYDFNDFDEATSGPYTWELARAAISIRLHAHTLGFGESATNGFVGRFLSAYYDRLGTLKPADLATPLTKDKLLGPALGAIADAAAYKEEKFRANWIRRGRLSPGKHLMATDASVARFLTTSTEVYARKRSEKPGFFKVKDAGRRVAGLASLSNMRYLVLVEGPTTSDTDDILLDFKEEGLPSSAPYLKPPTSSPGERVRSAWAYFVPNSDAYLGVAPGGGSEFLVRRLTPWKGEVEISSLKDATKFGQFLDTVALCAARAHARSGKASAIRADAGSSAKLAGRISSFATTYAGQVEADREVLEGYVDP